jgi:hypothetical protein
LQVLGVGVAVLHPQPRVQRMRAAAILEYAGLIFFRNLQYCALFFAVNSTGVFDCFD